MADVFIEEDRAHSPIKGAPTSVAAFVGEFPSGALNSPTLVGSEVEFEQSFGALSSRAAAGYSVRQFFRNGGQRCWIVRVGDDHADSIVGDAVGRTGLHSLDDIEGFNLLCVPGLSRLSRTDASLVIAAAEIRCERRRAFLIADVPDELQSAAAIISWLDANPALRHPNAALYYPQVRIADPSDANRTISLPPSGTIAGLMARIDDGRGVWQAPAGSQATLTDVIDLEYTLNSSEIDALTRSGVNSLRELPSGTPVCWSARTLGAPLNPEWKYVPNRRLALFLEESIDRGIRWAVFEPNDSILWTKLGNSVGNFLFGLWRDGALAGVKPEEAFFVRCDRSTTTQDEIDRGSCNMIVGFAPLKPAEFVVLRIQLRLG